VDKSTKLKEIWGFMEGTGWNGVTLGKASGEGLDREKEGAADIV
jgi:hypothetical protein